MMVKTRLIPTALFLATIATMAAPCLAQDGVVTIEGTRIRGDQEVPTVLYLVPWQPPAVQSLTRPDEQLMLERPLGPLERPEFRRLVSYHQHFQAGSGKGEEPETSDELTK